MQANQVKNVIVDEANARTYVVMASRLLSDGEIYRAIRQEILRRGGVPLAPGETLTLTLTAGGHQQPALVAAAPVVSGQEDHSQEVEVEVGKPDGNDAA